jgi:hypothetical protein
MTVLERRLAHFIMLGQPFTADDVTDNGAIAADAAHNPNSKQSSIGALFQSHARLGHIAFTGDVVKSTAKHRKGGMIRIWEGTESGRRWAAGVR